MTQSIPNIAIPHPLGALVTFFALFSSLFSSLLGIHVVYLYDTPLGEEFPNTESSVCPHQHLRTSFWSFAKFHKSLPRGWPIRGA